MKAKQKRFEVTAKKMFGTLKEANDYADNLAIVFPGMSVYINETGPKTSQTIYIRRDIKH